MAVADAIREHNYTCYACAIMPDHVHMMIRKHKHQAEDMLENLQDSSRLRASQRRICGPPDHPVWGGPGWKVFLDTPTDIRRTIRYIEENPPQWRLPRQQWSFVKIVRRLAAAPGHNPNSPYARSLREHRQ